MNRKLPALTPDSTPFWHGGARNELLIHFCADCERYFHPPAPVCPQCLGENIAPKKVSGKGHVMTFTLNYQQWHPDLDVPFAIAIVELVEQAGLRLVTNIVNCSPDTVHIGMRVKVLFINQEDVWIPLFEGDLNV